LYDKILKGKVELTEKEAENVMVDFGLKDDYESESSSDREEDLNEWLEYTDEFGRTRAIRRSEYEKRIEQERLSERKRQMEEMEEQERLKRPAGAEFYDPEKEIRTKGVGYYHFSREESERKKQKAELDDLRKETIAKRNAVQRIKQQRKEKVIQRLQLVRERRLKNGIEESSVVLPNDEEVDP
jgi:hypothetical protein